MSRLAAAAIAVVAAAALFAGAPGCAKKSEPLPASATEKRANPAFELPKDADLKTTASGLKYQVLKEGAGESPGRTSTVTCHYCGWLLGGAVFDSSYTTGKPLTIGVDKVIKGWTEGMQLMKPGAIYKFVIPANLAYRARSMPGIPPNSTLLFQVELLRVE